MGKVFVRYICAYCILVTAKETINYMINAVWSRSAVLYEMNLRQATPEGTLAAAAERLGFLRDLGIDAVWLMPHYPIGEVGRKGSLGSYYSIRDYRAVNPEFGTMADFDVFVRRAHALGMKVLIDWVANHTSRDARWLAECPADWYERDASGRPAVPNGWDDTAKLDYTNRAVWQGQIDAMRFWLAEHGVDGFRCDMAMLVPIEFWQEAARWLRAVKPDLFLLAEAEEDYLFDRAFDASYAWRLYHLMNDVAQQKCRVDRIREYLYADRKHVPAWALRLMFTSNHDENSWSGSEFVRLGPAVRVMTALTFLLPQSLPLVYTGQEFGYDHSFAFFRPGPAARLRAERNDGVLPAADRFAARCSGSRFRGAGRLLRRNPQQCRGLPADFREGNSGKSGSRSIERIAL